MSDNPSSVNGEIPTLDAPDNQNKNTEMEWVDVRTGQPTTDPNAKGMMVPKNKVGMSLGSLSRQSTSTQTEKPKETTMSFPPYIVTDPKEMTQISNERPQNPQTFPQRSWISNLASRFTRKNNS